MHWWKRIPLYWVGGRMYRRLLHVHSRYTGPATLRQMLAATSSRRIVIGSAHKFDTGWIPTEQGVLDLLKPEQWAQFFAPGSLDALLAEHVWEHLTLDQGVAAARTCFTYLKPGGYLRIAVPDGLNPNQEYIDWIRVGGASPGQHRNGHKVLYTYETLSDVLSQAGFRVVLYEYFDQSRRFHFHEWSREQGTIQRSKRYDHRNADGQLRFTSIVADAFKP